jgi:phage baseplate assembly protein W
MNGLSRVEQQTTTGGDFVGRGWAFPGRVGPRGGIALITGADEIDASLRMIIGTAPGERVMRPEFGCAIWNLLFAPTDANTLGLMAQSVREAIGRWEPRVELGEVTTRVDPEDASRVSIDVRYVIRATNDRRNLVYPFYVIPKEGAR